MEKERKRRNGAVFQGGPDVEERGWVFHGSAGAGNSPQAFFPFPQGMGIRQRLELMLVLISLTVSAKAGSFFIFFSTCWME